MTLGAVTPISCNLVRATLNPISTLPGTAFPAACCGGVATVTVTTTFTCGRQQHIRAVHADECVLAGIGDEGADRLQRDAE